MIRVTRSIAVLLVAAFPMLATGAHAEIPRVVLDQGNPQPIKIAIPDFYAGSPADAQVGADVARVVSDDLERSGLFAPIDPKAFIQDSASLQQSPRFNDWKLINAQALVSGVAQSRGNGQINGSIFVSKIWDGYATKNLLSNIGSPELRWAGGGGNGVFYNHCWADDMLNRFPFLPPPSTKQLKVVSTRTVSAPSVRSMRYAAISGSPIACPS